jgi:hypothetical protein
MFSNNSFTTAVECHYWLSWFLIHHYRHHHWQNCPFLPLSFVRSFCQIATVFHFFGFCYCHFFLQNRVVNLTSNPQTGGIGICVYVPSDRVAQLYPQALGSLFVASYDNLSSRTVALGSTQPLTEMSTRNLSVGKKRPALRLTNLSPSVSLLPRKCGSLDVS